MRGQQQAINLIGICQINIRKSQNLKITLIRSKFLDIIQILQFKLYIVVNLKIYYISLVGDFSLLLIPREN